MCLEKERTMKTFAMRAGLAAMWLGATSGTGLAAQEPNIPGGELRIIGPDGKPAGACPLRHTDVQADIAGFVGRTTVRQFFHNPTDRKIEAIYIFPLPHGAAVDDMVMTVGDRRILGQIKEREEARDIYEAAKAAGHVASLLDQERPNIFTQSVANIEPGSEVTIEISYVETLKYEGGVFEWVFPMVVGPRYIPGEPTSKIPPVSPLNQGNVVEPDHQCAGEGPDQPQGTGWSPDTTQVPDASKITPPVIKEGMRTGHDISLTVSIDGGTPVYDVASELHEIEATPLNAYSSVVRVALKDQAEIPNRDFVLHYRLATDDIGDAFLVHADERGTFFTLVLQPPRRILPEKVMPRELIFVLDTSGSMSGFPIEKAKEVMSKAIAAMLPADTFNLITFSGDTRILWEAPRPATDKNIAEAQAFLAGRAGGGGTEMMKAINAALVQTRPQQPARGKIQPIRVVCFMTDGYVGNDMAIIDAVKRNAGTTRVFSFGIGNGVNRFLLDGMARAGRGEVEYVTLEGEGDPAAARFHERILAPVLTDIQIDWGDLPVADVYPALIPDLFSAKPLMIHGRLLGPADGKVTLRGNTGAGPYDDEIAIAAPADAQDHEALASLWARAKVENLMTRDYDAAQQGTFPEDLKRQVIDLGLKYRLMTQYTSFVAVEEMTVTAGGEPVKVTVPVEMPAGVSYEGVFGAGDSGLSYQFSGGQPGAVPCMRARLMSPAVGAARAPVAGKRADWTRTRFSWDKDADGFAAGPAEAREVGGARLADTLRDLAARVAREGADGTLAIGKLKVTNYRVDVMILLNDLSETTLTALKELGFEQTSESKAVKLLIGSIDVRKLEDLAKLDAVIRVQPVVAP
jgi:Ca-activated chloride channel family protein